MIRTIISPIAHSAKPLEGGETKSSFFWTTAITEVPDIETLLALLFAGHTITPAYLQRSETDKHGPSNHSIFISQELWFVDLDNYAVDEKHPLGVDSDLTIENILSFCAQHNLNPFVIFESFSSSPQVPRFRVGFKSAEIVDDLEKRNQYISSLVDLFSIRFMYADIKCTDLARYYYGTHIDKIDSAWFDINAITRLDCITITEPINGINQPSSNDRYSNDSQVIPLLYRSYEAVAINDEIDVRYHCANCVSFEIFSDYRLGDKFHCEFHPDSTPSARIEQITGSKYLGEFRYACYSSNCHVYLSPVEYVIRKKSCSKAEALIYLLTLRNVPVYPEFWSNIHTTHPEACRTLGFDRGNGKGRNGSDQLMVSITSAAKLGIEVDGEVLFPLADKSIGEDLVRRGVIDVSPSPINIQPKRVRLCYLKLIRPIDDSELEEKNPAGLKYFREYQEKKRHRRRCNWYALSTVIPLDEQLRRACLIARDLSGGGSTGVMTHDMVSMTAGTEVANVIFVQDQNKELSTTKERLINQFSTVLRSQVENDGWSTKDKVLKAVYHRNYDFKVRMLNQAWYAIIKVNGFSLAVVNHSFREKLNIPKEINRGSKIVIKRSLLDELNAENA